MTQIVKNITLEQIKAENPDTIWYGYNSCWWTHRQEDVRTLEDVRPQREGDPVGLPCDPRGGVLMMCPAADFLADAEANPERFGTHGLDALMAAHNDNCIISRLDPRPYCLATWNEYNLYIDFANAGVRGLKGGRFA